MIASIKIKTKDNHLINKFNGFNCVPVNNEFEFSFIFEDKENLNNFLQLIDNPIYNFKLLDYKYTV